MLCSANTKLSIATILNFQYKLMETDTRSDGWLVFNMEPYDLVVIRDSYYSKLITYSVTECG